MGLLHHSHGDNVDVPLSAALYHSSCSGPLDSMGRWKGSSVRESKGSAGSQDKEGPFLHESLALSLSFIIVVCIWYWYYRFEPICINSSVIPVLNLMPITISIKNINFSLKIVIGSTYLFYPYIFLLFSLRIYGFLLSHRSHLMGLFSTLLLFIFSSAIELLFSSLRSSSLSDKNKYSSHTQFLCVIFLIYVLSRHILLTC